MKNNKVLIIILSFLFVIIFTAAIIGYFNKNQISTKKITNSNDSSLKQENKNINIPLLNSEKGFYTFILDEDIKNSKNEICSNKKLTELCNSIMEKIYIVDYLILDGETVIEKNDTLKANKKYILYDSSYYFDTKTVLLFFNDQYNIIMMENNKINNKYMSYLIAMREDKNDEEDEDDNSLILYNEDNFPYNYILDANEDEDEDDDDEKELYSYYAFNKKNNMYYKMQPITVGNDEEDKKLKNHYYIDGEDVSGIINVNNNSISTDYEDYNCYFHSDERCVSCKDGKTIIVSKLDNTGKILYGLLSLDDYHLILPVEYTGINEIDNGNFIVKKDDKVGIVNNKAKEIIKLENNYIAYNNYFGYIVIKDNKVNYYDKDYKPLSINDNNDIISRYNSSLKEYNKKLEKEFYEDLEDENEKYVNENYLAFENDNNHWSSYSYLIEYDISKNSLLSKIDGLNIKYIGQELNDSQVLLIDNYSSCYSKPIVYAINGSTAIKINSKDIKIKTLCF